MRKFFKLVFVVLPAFVLLFLLVLWVAVSNKTPLVQHVVQDNPDEVHRVKALLNKFKVANNFDAIMQVGISERDVSSLFAMMARAFPRLRGDAQIRPEGGQIRISLHVPENPLGDYINIQVFLPPSSRQGLQLQGLSIGAIHFNQYFSQQVLIFVLDVLFDEQQRVALLSTVESLRTQHRLWILTYKPLKHIDEKLFAALGKWQRWGNEEESLRSVAEINYYYKQLCRNHESNVSLAKPLARLLKIAAKRSDSDAQAVQENQALLLALTLYYGAEQVEKLEQLLNIERKPCQSKPLGVTLANRTDLAQHFLYSAVLKILSNHHISFAVGEWKEMNDALQGGSGFSFVDLTADQAGIRFVEFASSLQYAQWLHNRASQLADENMFFPTITGLVENIPQQVFEQHYGGSSGKLYLQQLADIRQRISVLPLYSSH